MMKGIRYEIMLKLMYITNKPEVAQIAELAGVNRIFVDMEYIGKYDRQSGMDTVQSHHTIEDIKRISSVISNAELLVRVNPIHDATESYCSSEDEINKAIEAGADIIMLPYFTTIEEVEKFVKIVDGRARVFPLLESKEALEKIDDLLKVNGIDEIHIGLNDLSIDLKKKFMFELLTDGTVESLCKKIKEASIPYGFGGIGRLGYGEIPAEYIIKEHYRLGSTCVILSRSFCNANLVDDLKEIKNTFEIGINEIRNLEKECKVADAEYFDINKQILNRKIQEIVEKKKK